MVKLYDTGVFLIDGKTIIEDNENKDLEKIIK